MGLELWNRIALSSFTLQEIVVSAPTGFEQLWSCSLSRRMGPAQLRLDVGKLKDERVGEKFANRLSGVLGNLMSCGVPSRPPSLMLLVYVLTRCRAKNFVFRHIGDHWAELQSCSGSWGVKLCWGWTRRPMFNIDQKVNLCQWLTTKEMFLKSWIFIPLIKIWKGFACQVI